MIIFANLINFLHFGGLEIYAAYIFIASKPKADHFCDGRDMSSIKYQKETTIKFQIVENH